MSVRSTYRFARLPEWVLFHPGLDALDCRLFCILDRFDGRDCFPALSTLAERLDISEDTVRRSLRRLEKVDAIRVEERFTNEGRQTSNRYVLAGDNPCPPRTTATVEGGTDATLPPCTDATQSRASKDPEQEEPPQSPPVTSPVDRTSLEGDSIDRKQRIADEYARLALERAEMEHYAIGAIDKYLASKKALALGHRQIDEYMRRFRDAPPNAVASWLHGEKHSMQYYRDSDDVHEELDGPVVAMPAELRRKRREVSP